MKIPSRIKLFAKAALSGVYNTALLDPCNEQCKHAVSTTVDYKTKTVVHTCRAEGCGSVVVRSLKEIG